MEVNGLARGDPSLREFECIIFPEGVALGERYFFQIEAFNRQGSVMSLTSAELLLAGVPAGPGSAALGPDALYTDSRQIKVVY